MRRCRSTDSSRTSRTASTSCSGGTATATSSSRRRREDMSFSLSPPDAAFVKEFHDSLGALLVGRRLFDITDGWSGLHPLGVPVVVTHSVPDAWIERRSGRAVHVRDGRRCRTSGRDRERDRRRGPHGGRGRWERRQPGHPRKADGLVIDLAPVVLGAGRPFFDGLKNAEPVRLSEPRVVQGAGAVPVWSTRGPGALGRADVAGAVTRLHGGRPLAGPRTWGIGRQRTGLRQCSAMTPDEVR